MDLKILDEVAYLFVDQFDNLYGMLVDRTDVRRIRKAADDGLDAIYDVVSSVFGDKLEEVLYGAAYTAMDSIAYEDESWTPKDAEDREMTLDMARLHLDSLKGVLQMAEQNGHGNVGQIKGLLAEAEGHLKNLEER